MTALLGAVGRSLSSVAFERALQRLCWTPARCAERLLDQPHRQLARIDVLERQGGPPAVTGTTSLYLAGAIERNGSVVNTAAVLRAYDDQKLAGLGPAEGEHVLALFDDDRRRLILQSDLLASVPLFYGSYAGRFAFGPDAFTVLLLLGRKAQINPEAAAEFLINRYLIGDHGLYAHVKRLGPGERLEVDLDSTEYEHSRYWDLRFTHELSDPRAARAALHEALTEAHGALFSVLQPSEGYHCFLTGGMDSRGILAYARALDCLPQRAITWGERDDIADSDPTIARQLAGMLGVPFGFQAIRADDWVTHAARWADISGLLSDNGNSFASAPDVFAAHGTNQARFVVLGDEAFGAGPVPANLQQAIENIQRTSLHTDRALLGRVLNADAAEQAVSAFQTDLLGLADRCPGRDLKDVQDYLFFHTYIARWILAPGNFKWPVYSARRPMLALNVLEQVGRLTPLLRVDKRVYVELLEERFQDIAAVPRTTRDSGIDWGAALRREGRFREHISHLLDDDALDRLPMADIFNSDGVRSLVVEAMAPSAGQRVSVDGPLKRSLYSMRRRLSRSPSLARMMTRVQPWVLRATGQLGAESRQRRHQVLMRLALLQHAVDAQESLNAMIPPDHADDGLDHD
ncbi:MAG: hypothetical protein ACXIUL_00780 [Wenzhouxiangella sp.]